jgi:hypothetical protein
MAMTCDTTFVHIPKSALHQAMLRHLMTLLYVILQHNDPAMQPRRAAKLSRRGAEAGWTHPCLAACSSWCLLPYSKLPVWSSGTQGLAAAVASQSSVAARAAMRPNPR